MLQGAARFALGAMLAVLVAGARPVPLGAQFVRPLGDERLEALSKRYFDEQWKNDPIRATQVGIHDYDALLPDFSAAAFEARIATTRRYLSELQAIDVGSLGAEGSYDRAIFESDLQTTLVNLQTRETWRHDPSFYTGRLSQAVYGLLSRNFAPLHERVRELVARERLMPAALLQAQENVSTVDPVTADIARRNIAGTLTFFATVVPQAVKPAGDPALQNTFKATNDAVVAALRSYQSAMEGGPLAHPSGSYAIGSELFARLLALQELTPLSLATYERVGVEALEKTKAEFVATARAIDPSKSPQDVAASLGTQRPAEGALLKKATDDLALLRSFVVEHRIITLPPENDVKVVPTPEFARQTSFASMNAPGPLEKTATEAYYNVTPVEADWTTQRKEQHLSFFNDYAFPIISAHEVMPGHYVNFALDKHEQLTLIRRLLRSVSFAEGWAHYDEQMMVDEGWGGGDPRVRLAQLQLALQRECRYLVGLREHTQGLSVADATTFFEQNAFMAEEPSHREALRGTQDPLYGYYTLGKLELLKLRDDYHKMLGAKFTLQVFHDALLAHGDPPLAVARKILLGANDDGKLL